MKQSLLRLLAVLFAFALIAAACGDDDDDGEVGTADDSTEETADDGGETADDDGEMEEESDDGAMEEEDPEPGPSDDDGGEADLAGSVVTILGPETGEEAAGFEEAFAPFTERTGIEIQYTGSRDATTEMNLAVEGGNPPNLGVVPQPGRIIDYANNGDILPLSDDVLGGAADQYATTLFEAVTVDGGVYGMPNKGDVKSLVWYSPSVFADNGYDIPTSWDELTALSDQMIADGIAPWCVGIGSGDATGWPFTDWMEDIMLRLHGPDVYDQWVRHEIPFNDPQVAEAAQFVADIWFTDGNVAGGRDIIAQTGFQEAGLGVLSGDCGMHRQANFYAAQFVDAGATIGTDVDVFYLPTISDDFGDVLLTAGTYVVAFDDDPATQAVLAYIGSTEYADTRIAADKGGFLSPNLAHDTSLYTADLDRTLADLLVNASPARFDASDLMPGEVGGGEFWQSGTDFVSGAITLEEFLDNVEDAWPS